MAVRTTLNPDTYLATTPFIGSLEYDVVVAASSDPARLERLHRTRINPGQAIALVELLLRILPIYRDGYERNGKVLPVRSIRAFFAGQRGRASANFSKEPGAVHLRILLPGFSHRLRVGIVLHEYAHHLVGLKHRHDRTFTGALDLLCEFVETGKIGLPEQTAAGTTDLHRAYSPRSACRRCRVATTRKHSILGTPCCGRCERAGA